MATTVIETSPELITKSGPLIKLSVVPVAGYPLKQDEGTLASHTSTTDLSVWRDIDAESATFESEHHRFWWDQHTGKALAILLQNAGYSTDLQYRDLKFFRQVIAPYLGISRKSCERTASEWPSFMTDDGNPVELSWDWGTNDEPPTIRYSVEPIGLHAGTSLDPENLAAAPSMYRQLIGSLPKLRQEWFQHFLEYFNTCNDRRTSLPKSGVDHRSSIFYAFDLSPTDITAKTYFFPKFRAAHEHRSNLDVLSEAIYTTPGGTMENLQAWSIFHRFATQPQNQNLEHEMLAIDLIDPLRSRLKIYFRCRETTFNSVINIMTLGGRLNNPMLYRGLTDLAHLWNALFDVDAPLDEPLGESSHRTAGILYNVEFKLGDRSPVAKIYMPVRHYARSDDAIIRGLDKYLRSHRRGRYMPGYMRTMNSLFSEEALRAGSGMQTYVGATIRPNGSLRVVSYFKSDIPAVLSGSKDEREPQPEATFQRSM